MSRPTLTRKVATLRATMWLNSLSDALDSGVLVIHPGLSDERVREISRELASFCDVQLPKLRRDLGTPADCYATWHLRRWEVDFALYPLTRLLVEQERHRQSEEDE